MPHTLQSQRFRAVGMLESRMSVCNSEIIWIVKTDFCGCIAARQLELFLTCPTLGTPEQQPVTSLSHTCGTDFSWQQSLLAPFLDWEEKVMVLAGTAFMGKAYEQDTLLFVQLSSFITVSDICLDQTQLAHKECPVGQCCSFMNAGLTFQELMAAKASFESRKCHTNNYIQEHLSKWPCKKQQKKPSIIVISLLIYFSIRTKWNFSCSSCVTYSEKKLTKC